MTFDKERYNRRSIRLAGYDYRTEGAYFVTICSHQKKSVFGRISGGVMHSNVYGRIVSECWDDTPDHYPQVILDEWILMPNHLHGILILEDVVGAQHATPLSPYTNVLPGSLGAIIRSFKSAATRRINTHRADLSLAPVVVWQRNFYERIIRDEKELDDTRRYIAENPLNWGTDVENPNV